MSWTGPSIGCELTAGVARDPGAFAAFAFAAAFSSATFALANVAIDP